MIEDDETRRRSRKLMRLTFSMHLPAWVMAEVIDQLPSDCFMVGVVPLDPERGVSSLVFWSDQFEAIPDSQMLQELIVRVTTDPRIVEIGQFRNGDFEVWEYE